MRTARILKGACISLVAVIVIIVILVGGVFAFSTSLAGSAPPPLQLPPMGSTSQTASPASPDGTWSAQNGSEAGFRVGVGLSSTIVGRTSDVTGSINLSHNEIASGSFQIDLSRVTVGGKQNASFFKLLETNKYPSITISFPQPVVLPAIPTDGQAISFKAPASLSIHGITKTVALKVNARDDGSRLEAAGSAPLLASDWNVKSPFGVQNDTLIEFLLVLQRK